MRLLSITPEDDKEIISLVSAEGLSQRNHLPSKVNVQTALTWYFDLQGVPKKSVLRSFSHFTENKQEQEAFRDLLRINEESTKKYHVAVKKARYVLALRSFVVRLGFVIFFWSLLRKRKNKKKKKKEAKPRFVLLRLRLSKII